MRDGEGMIGPAEEGFEVTGWWPIDRRRRGKLRDVEQRLGRVETQVERMRSIVNDPLLDPERLEWLADAMGLLDAIADSVNHKLQIIGPGVELRRDGQDEIRQLARKVAEYRQAQQ